MLVYRMEHKELKCGPFTGFRSVMLAGLHADEYSAFTGFNREWAYYFNLESHPLPYDDGVENFESDVDICGVDSMEQILAWFGEGECLTWLKHAGCIIRAYDVPDVKCKIGKSQVAYPIDNYPIVEEITL